MEILKGWLERNTLISCGGYDTRCSEDVTILKAPEYYPRRGESIAAFR